MWYIFDNVEENNVFKIFESCEVGECVVDIFSVDKCDFFVCYNGVVFFCVFWNCVCV